MSYINKFTAPRQRLPYSKKTKEWRKKNVDAGDSFSFYHSESVRQTLKNKIINLNLYNGIVDIRDLTLLVNPHQLDASFVPDNIPHHPIAVPKIDLLVGEESKRRFDFNVIVTNPNAITAKEEAKKKVLNERLTAMLKANYAEDELEKKYAEFENFMKYSWQDVKEKLGNQILQHYYKEQDFKNIFTKGFKDALLLAEEIYLIDVIHDEPILTKLNPLKVHSVRSGNSDRIEDSNVIILEDHWSPGKIVDYFHDELKPSDIDDIIEGNVRKSNDSFTDDHNNHVLIGDKLASEANSMGGNESLNGLLGIAEINGHSFSSDYTDLNGNVRVLRVFWKSLKKIKKVKYYDEFGDEEYKIMSEEYIPNEDMGEEATDLWVNEWWEGTKIGKDIYISMKPRRIQYNKINNPSYCHPGIIGQVYNTNQGKAVSLMDRMKNYQYMYDVMWDRLNKAISTNYGKIANVDLAGIPEGWEIEKWLHFAIVNKIAFRDSFKEGNQGAATGKLAGSFNNGQSSSIDMETGNYIQQHIQMLEFIKNEMGEIAGVTRQREGQVSNNETLGGVERSVNQSAHITEFWFQTHEAVKLRVLNAFLEAAKIALKGNNKKSQYILDDETIEILNLEGDEFLDVDMGVMATNSSKAVELEQALKQYAQAFLQNGGSLSTIMDIYFSPSLSDMRRKLEIAEEKIREQNMKSQEDANKLAQQAQADAKELELMKLKLEEAKNIRDNETKIYISDNSKEEPDTDGIESLDAEKLNLDATKHKDDVMIKIKDLQNKMEMHRDKMSKEDKKIAVSKQKKVTQ